MTATAVDRTADRLEQGARAVAAAFTEHAASAPNSELLGIIAATAAQIIENAAMRAGLVASDVAAGMEAEARAAGEEIAWRVADGLQPAATGELDLERLSARLMLQLAQGRLAAWERAAVDLRELMPQEGTDGA